MVGSFLFLRWNVSHEVDLKGHGFSRAAPGIADRL